MLPDLVHSKLVAKDAKDVGLASCLRLIGQARVLVQGVEAEGRHQASVLLRDPLDLHYVELRQIVLFENVQDPLKCSIEELAADASLLVRFYLLSAE